MIDKTILEAKIHSLFPVERSGQDSFWRDDYLEGQRVREVFFGKDWTSINIYYLRNACKGDISACLSFMTEKGVIYYFPAFLLDTIRDYYAADMIADGLMYEMSGLIKESSLGMAFDLLEKPQLELVLECLEYLSEKHG